MSCVLHSYHAPVPQGRHRHHVIPLAWTRALGLPESRVVDLCPTGHDNVHRDLRLALNGRMWYASPKGRELVLEPFEFYKSRTEEERTNLRTIAAGLVEE